MSTTLAGFDVTKPASAGSADPGLVEGALDTSAVYQYKVTYVSAFGETDGNDTAASDTTTSTGSMVLSSIPTSSNGNVTQRKLYRTAGGGSTFLLLATLEDNTTTTYTDIIADASLGAAIPTLNTAGSRQAMPGNLIYGNPIIYSIESGITATPGGGQAAAYALTKEYNILGTVATANDSVRLPELNANTIGMHVLIANDGAQSANVFPFTGQNASAGTDTAVAVAAAARAEFVARTATVWVKTR